MLSIEVFISLANDIYLWEEICYQAVVPIYVSERICIEFISSIKTPALSFPEPLWSHSRLGLGPFLPVVC